MKKQMRTLISLIKKYNAVDHKVDERYARETKYHYGPKMLMEFENTGKSSVLRRMQSRLASLNDEINELAVQIDITPSEWDADIRSADLCIDSWNHHLVFSLIAEQRRETVDRAHQQ